MTVFIIGYVYYSTVEEQVASTADYRSFSAKQERHADVHTWTHSSELHFIVF